MIIAGLGNPGRTYAHTRHNLGFRVLDSLARKWRVEIKSKRFQSLLVEGRRSGKEFVLMKPQTMMNESGKAVKQALAFYNLGTSEFLVVCDDFNLPLGIIRLRRRGSSGGHRGIQSVIDEIGDEGFPRLRLGIGQAPPGRECSDYVLEEFFADERECVENMIPKALKAIELFFRKGIDEAMRWSNRKEACCG